MLEKYIIRIFDIFDRAIRKSKKFLPLTKIQKKIKNNNDIINVNLTILLDAIIVISLFIFPSNGCFQTVRQQLKDIQKMMRSILNYLYVYIYILLLYILYYIIIREI